MLMTKINYITIFVLAHAKVYIVKIYFCTLLYCGYTRIDAGMQMYINNNLQFPIHLYPLYLLCNWSISVKTVLTNTILKKNNYLQ